MKPLYKYLAFAVLILSFQACKKELGALPKNAKVDANTILDQGTAQIALNGAYYCFANASKLKTGWQDHEVATGMLAGYLEDAHNTAPETENMNGKLNYYWTESYTLLNAVNGVLKGVSALPDSKFTANRKKEMIAEAHFLRAYGHYKILSYYGEWFNPNSTLGILLRDELSTLSNIPKARSSVKESYDFILADLDDVIANGPDKNPNYYVTKWAGMALKMRVLMGRGTAADYAEVITLANTLINGNQYELEAKAEDIFHKLGLASKEVILGIKPQANQQLDYYSKSAQYWPGASSLNVTNTALKTLLNDDPRQAWMVGSVIEDETDIFYFTKYILENTKPTQVSEADYALRLTEVYLLQAEAMVRSGSDLAEPKRLVHLIQSKAGITATSLKNSSYLAVENATNKDDLLVEIYKETVKSLMAEDGMEWLSLLRLPFDTVKKLRPTITNKSQYIFPVPRSEFLYNPSFGDQNPGYDKN